MEDDKELATMTAVAKALDAVKDEEELTARVLQWVNSRYGKTKAVPGHPGKNKEAGTEEFNDIADLFATAGPTTDAERALVAGYWFQVHEQNENIVAQTVNTALKHLGHQIGNITSAFDSLMDRSPSLVIQVHKHGKTKQARKRYRLTNAGLQAIRHMLSGQTED